MTSTRTIQTVKDLKKSLASELAKDSSDDVDPCVLDMLKRLDELPVDFQILTETLVGAVVSKFKSNSNQEVASTAKTLVRKWKRQAKRDSSSANATATTTTSASSTPASKKKPSSTTASRTPTSTKKPTSAKMASAVAASIIADPVPDSEWLHLPTHRKNMATKFYTIFRTSETSLLETGLNSDSLSPLVISRATEVEDAIHVHSRGNRTNYSAKIRSLIFNLKSNGNLREKIILGFTSVHILVNMSPADLATEEKNKERTKTIEKVQDSMQLDWNDHNEDKINKQCGIVGDLLKASLFTCGRCKSIKTTSTQKQTRSADEPMTVFVFCLNCGKRWKC
eukprot:CAMPEP_0198256642 /NCGR_PEP_ID=MMETSP1447-20131203/6514_1 /TAXON_ID=420782 /ORGANISM="Chaetoceros dichaeta, Strain CCMP1751" /LENGTH=337 /DNA_ID=CAMNT_0043943337 /DNA_START=65 /DNA_END=1078 /DNA_ORIENTATION=+